MLEGENITTGKQMEIEYVKMRYVYRPGMPNPNHCIVYKKCEGIQVLIIQFSERWCDIAGTGSDDDIPMILFENPGNEKYENILNIEFPDYKGWDLMCAESGKYSCILTMVKNDV